MVGPSPFAKTFASFTLGCSNRGTFSRIEQLPLPDAMQPPRACRNDKEFLHSLVVTSDAVFPLSKPLEFCHSERAVFARRNLLSLGSGNGASAKLLRLHHGE